MLLLDRATITAALTALNEWRLPVRVRLLLKKMFNERA